MRLPAEIDSRERMLDPFPWYETMRKDSPVRYDESRDRWDVFRYDDVKRVLSDHTTFSAAGASDFDVMGGLGKTMADTNPPEHERLRGVVDDYFTPGNLNQMKPVIRSATDRNLDRALNETDEIEVITELTAPVTTTTIAQLLGGESDRDEIIERWSNMVQAQTGEGDIRQIYGNLQGYFDDLIEERHRNPTDDLITLIADAGTGEASLSRDEQLSFCILLFIAGHETTTHAVGNALWTLEEQGLYTELREGEIDLASTFDESVRYRGPVHALSGRRTTEAVELSGTTIPEGEQVTSWIGSANRDPRQFDDPEEFRPERKPNRHIAFGFGLHYCLGAPLARLEAETIIGAVTDRVDAIEVDPAAIEPERSPIGYGADRLPMRFHSSEDIVP